MCVEQPFLLGRGIADEHRPLELREVAPDRRACTRDEHVAGLEHEVSGESVGERRISARSARDTRRYAPLEKKLCPL